MRCHSPKLCPSRIVAEYLRQGHRSHVQFSRWDVAIPLQSKTSRCPDSHTLPIAAWHHLGYSLFWSVTDGEGFLPWEMNYFSCHMKIMGVWILYFPLSFLVVMQDVWLRSTIPILCVHLVWWGGGGFIKDVTDSEIEQHFQADFSVIKDHLLNHTRSLIKAKLQLKTSRFFRLKFYCIPLIFKRWPLQHPMSLWGCFWVSWGIQCHFLKSCEIFSRDYIKLTSRKTNPTKTVGAKQLNRRIESKKPVYEEFCKSQLEKPSNILG